MTQPLEMPWTEARPVLEALEHESRLLVRLGQEMLQRRKEVSALTERAEQAEQDRDDYQQSAEACRANYEHARRMLEQAEAEIAALRQQLEEMEAGRTDQRQRGDRLEARNRTLIENNTALDRIQRENAELAGMWSTRALKAEDELITLRATKDGAYRERNLLVAALSRMFPSHLTQHPVEDTSWDRDWLTIVCIHSPSGQLTWHIHNAELDQFVHLQHEPNDWDGHSTEEKYRRLSTLRAALARREGQTCVWSEDDLGIWQTACGHTFELNEGTPSENKLRFCGYCGATLQEIGWQPREEPTHGD